MKHTALLLVLLWVVSAPVWGQIQSAAEIDQLLESALDKTGPSSFILVNKEIVLYANSFAADPAERNTAKRYKVASGAKWLTAATLLALADKQIIDLDDKVLNYLPQFKGDKGQMTIRQLLSHTSGMPPNTVYIKNKDLSLKASVDSIALNVKLNAAPGSKFSYGGVGFQIAARIAEVATGKDWETIFQEQVAIPCNMKHTDFGKQKNKDIGDGAYSTAEDYVNFLQMILNKGKFNGKQVLSEKAVKEMMTDHSSMLPVGYTPYRFISRQNSGYYGLGVWIDRIMTHDRSATEISSQGGRGFTPWVNTCKGIAGVFAVYGNFNEILPTIVSLKEMVDTAFPDNCDDIHTSRINGLLTESDGGFSSIFVSANKVTKIVFGLAEDSQVNLTLFDPLGNELEVLLDGTLKKGEYSFPVDASGLKPGVYFYKLTVNGKTETKKLVISANSSN